jgi:hypothetical protein
VLAQNAAGLALYHRCASGRDREHLALLSEPKFGVTMVPTGVRREDPGKLLARRVLSTSWTPPGKREPATLAWRRDELQAAGAVEVHQIVGYLPIQAQKHYQRSTTFAVCPHIPNGLEAARVSSDGPQPAPGAGGA